MEFHINSTDIENLVTSFYKKVQADELLGPVFNDIVQVDWQEHLLLLNKFWRSIMLKTREYHGNAYSKHAFLAQKTLITEAHFARWLNLFTQEAHDYLSAEDADTIVVRANSIANSLRRAMLKNTE